MTGRARSSAATETVGRGLLASLMARLERHGVKARMHISRSDAKAGEMIKDHAESLGVDLVVMDLYGHSRLRELVLGGASRTMLIQETFPLLVSR
ncbi:MAG: universal stress protein UspA [Caulobacteraceae bacterium]|jgi:nucleotide-binding universal stress UspA family protein|nr:universal stress protein UspA [Caulobacteraceae bacterium]